MFDIEVRQSLYLSDGKTSVFFLIADLHYFKMFSFRLYRDVDKIYFTSL